MKSTKTTISTEQDYNAVMAQIDALMKKGEENLSSSEIKKLRVMAEDAEAWEDKSFSIKVKKPDTLSGMVELRMFELKIPNQVALSRLIKIDTPKLSQILNGKRKADIEFLKAVHKKLKIDAEFLLEKA
ncbi:MAG: transcriptional regulator [Bacteroidota bacterium]